MNAYQRRSKITELTLNNPMTTRQLSKALETGMETIFSDVDMLIKRGIAKVSGRAGKYRLYACMRFAPPEEFGTRRSTERRKSAVIQKEDIPEALRIMFGYTDIEPEAARFINNEHFHPTPTRTARVEVHPGTSWAHMEMAL